MTAPATFDPGTPYTRTDIEAAMGSLSRDALGYLQAIPAPEFVAPQGAKWSPADHVRHLSKSGFAIALGLRAPRLLLRVAFGQPKRTSRRFLTLRDDYRGALAAGAQAGPFAPEPKPMPNGATTFQAEVLAQWETAHDAMGKAMAKWAEDSLDRYVLKHPAMGPLTVREMLMFAHYHESHHLNLLAGRRD